MSEMSTDPTELVFEHAVSVEQLQSGTFEVDCTCGFTELHADEISANDAAGGHHAETIG